MKNLLIRLLVNAVALWIAALVVDGIAVPQSVLGLLLVALIFGLVNALIRPILAGATCAINVLTLGLFTLIINALMLLLTSYLSGLAGEEFAVNGFVPALLGAVVIGVISFVSNLLIKDEK